jgi:hypothetical protein
MGGHGYMGTSIDIERVEEYPAMCLLTDFITT